MTADFYIEVNSQQKNHDGERICGDVFLYRYIKEEDRVIAVLSDGMGHGVKANILATLTATMALNFAREHKEVERIAEIIMNTLPVCSVRKISYSTFTIIDIEKRKRLYTTIDSIAMQNAIMVPLYYDEVVRFTRKNVKGLGINPINMLDLKRVKKVN